MPSTKVNQQCLDSFFKPDATCNTTYVYLSSRGEGESRDSILVKYIKNQDDPCSILFTKKGSYYYIYSFLLQQILVWAKDPRAFARKGYLGHHTTIGFKGNTLDIHDTFYNAFTDKYDNIILAKTSKQIFYTVDQNNELIKASGHSSMFQEANKILWNDIKCHQLAQNQTGSGKYISKKVVKLLNPKFLPPETKHISIISTIAHLINKRLQEAYKHMESKKYTCGAVVIPYVSKNVEKRVIQKLALNEDHVNIMFSCHDHDTRCSVICINMWNV